MKQPKVTIIVTQRERFCLTKLSLESIIKDDSYPFELIYVDCNSPSEVSEYLQEQAEKYEFMTLIRYEKYLRQNAARNLALPLVNNSEYLVFIENDIIVEKGWLKPIVECAEQEQAAIISPLILEGNPKSPNKQVHIFGINLNFETQESGERSLKIQHLMHHEKLENQILQRSQVDAVEFHCALVRYSLLQKLPLDEVFDNLESHIDLCIQAKNIGEKVFVEPSSQVTFLDPRIVNGFDGNDIKLYLFRWNNKLVIETLTHAAKKWNVDIKDPYWVALQNWATIYRGLVSGTWVVS
ncbi:MAG: glycosyltransferase [Rivularia sp. (in: cyanobacteria)]